MADTSIGFAFDESRSGWAKEHVADAHEIALVQALVAGNESAYEQLIARFERPVYNLVARLIDDPSSASDVVQEVFLKIFRRVNSFRGDCALKTWVYRIAVNEARNQVRWSIRHRHKEVAIETDDGLGGAEWMTDSKPSPLEIAADQETHALIAEVLGQVAPAYRAALVLREVEGLSYEEIAQILETNLGTVKSRIVRGREDLRQRMLEKMDRRAPQAGWRSKGVLAG